MHPDPNILDDLVQRIVEVAHPRQIILFGSAVRGEMGPRATSTSWLLCLMARTVGIQHRRSISI